MKITGFEKVKHTMGPWAVCDDGVNVYAPETDTAITNDRHPCYPDDTEAKANARLIAAAPLLYEALSELLAIRETYVLINPPDIEQRRKAQAALDAARRDG